MIVRSSASPLIHLSKLKLLAGLEVLFHEVPVSKPVLEEVLGHGNRAGATEVASAAHLRREEGAVDALRAEEIRESENLGRGEASTLAAAERLLAKRLSADLVIVDDRRAREVARRPPPNARPDWAGHRKKVAGIPYRLPGMCTLSSIVIRSAPKSGVRHQYRPTSEFASARPIQQFCEKSSCT